MCSVFVAGGACLLLELQILLLQSIDLNLLAVLLLLHLLFDLFLFLLLLETTNRQLGKMLHDGKTA